MSTPNPSNLLLGAGEVFIDRYTAAGVPSGLWRHLGNCKQFQLTANAESISMDSSMEGSGGTYAEAITKVSGKANIQMTEFDAENVAISILGATATLSQSSGSASDVAISGTVKKGYALSTGKYNITVTAVKKGVTVLVEGTDYSVNPTSGLIMILPGSVTLSDGDSITWSGSYTAITNGTKVLALTNAKVLCALKHVPAADQSGPRYVTDVFKCQIVPKTVMDLISDNYAELAVEASVLKDTTRVSATQSQFWEQALMP